MSKRLAAATGLVLAAVWLSPGTPALAGPATAKRAKKPRADTTKVECYGRKPGDYTRGDGGKAGRVMVRLKRDLKTTDEKLADVHYADRHTYRSAPLKSLVERCQAKKRHASKSGDLLLFHFENGMVIPFPNDEASLRKLDARIALDVHAADGSWAGKFPAAERDDTVTMDAGAMVFGQNKIVVSTPWYPSTDGNTVLFSPWRHADSLVGVEFADRAAYEAQFHVPGNESLAVAWGERVFLRNCQYCHSVSDVGSSYAWDFVVPIPLHEHKRPKALYDHVTVREYNASEKGLMMPTQPLEKRDVAGLLAWSKARKAASKTKASFAYKPGPTAPKRKPATP